MPYDFENWKRCKRCGSYMPSDWTRCGRCGYPAYGRRAKRPKGWLIILILIFSVFIFRNELLSLIPESVKERFASIIPGNPSGPDASRDSETGGSAIDTPHAGNNGSSMAGGAPESAPSGYDDTENPADEKEIAELIRKAVKNAEKSVKLPLLNTSNDSEIIFGIIEELVLSDPEIMFYEGCTYRTDGLLSFEYSKSADFIHQAIDDTKRKADEIISRIIVPGMSEYEKELAIHDYLVNSCRYDVENLARDAVPPEGHEAYGPIIAGKAVCGGYAKAVKLLLGNAGVESLVVTGTSKGELHAWNIVRISGMYYHVDVTWDDPVMDGGNQILQHTYFNLTDSDIGTDHDWDRSGYPSCSSTSFNYYHYNGLTVSSEDEFAALMKNAVESGSDSMSVRFADGSARGVDMTVLLERTATALKLKSISYSVNEDYGIVDVWFR